MLKFVVTIPSYKRSDVIATKTLAVLQLGNVPVHDIYVFVVPEEEQAYKKACPNVQVIVGQPGLVNQRKFIQDFFDIGTYIVMMDDDITEIYKPVNLKTRESITDLPTLFQQMITRMKSEDVSICGIYPVDNLKFALGNSEFSTDFRYIVGALYLIQNLREVELQYGDALEDRERTVLYYLKERKTLRFNHICIKTKYFAPGGMLSTDRIKKHSEMAQELVRTYPEYLRLKETKNCLDAKCRKKKN